MRVRAIDENNDWTFGKGLQSYKVDAKAVAQLCKTNIQNFLGDVFWATNEGIDWFNLLEKGYQAELERAIKLQILTTDGVSSLKEFYLERKGRELNGSFTIETIYSQSYRDEFNLQF